jgi:hypothetical protein
MANRESLYNPAITINNIDVKFKPNTLSFTEGFGEYKVRARSGGGGATDTIFSRDIETAYSTVKFNLLTTKDQVELARLWKSKDNTNTITITDSDSQGNQLISRTFKFAAMINDPPVNITADGDVEIEFHSDPAQ